MALLDRIAAWFGPEAGRRAVVEECEPRILYSADLNPALWAGGPDAAAEVRLVDERAPDASTALAAERQTARREIVFIDAAVPDAQALIDGLIAARPAGTQVEVVRLAAGADGLAQIGTALAAEQGLDAIHLVTHGDAGRLQLGDATVDLDTLRARDAELQRWRAALTGDADILLWGCNVGQGAAGEAFVEQLAAATQADVAASVDVTGAAARGGDWQLELAHGRIETGLAPGALAQWDGLLATFTVTNTADSGAGSLRQAILDANALIGADNIHFNIAGAGVHTISVSSALPTLTGTVTLDGYTQAGSSRNTLATGSNAVLLIEIDGTAAGATSDGLRLGAGAGGSTVSGLVINRFGDDGIEIDGSGGHTIDGNVIGLNAAGSTALGNGGAGVYVVTGINNLVGGTTPGSRNVLSGNGNSGVYLLDTGTVVAGNYIGTNAAGTAALGNGAWGVYVAADNSVVGGAAAGAGNVIAGSNVGVIVNAADGTTVAGNLVGLNATGTAALSNGTGIVISNAANTLIGGTTASSRNVVSGNTGDGILVTGAASTGTLIQGNYIGTNAAGTAALGNSNGVYLDFGTSGSTVGGTTAGAGNLISGNTGRGVRLEVSSGNTVQGNYIGTDAAGNAALANGYGVGLFGGSINNLIGGTTAAARNVISGNTIYGVELNGTATRNNTVSGNYIGLDAAGTAGLGNGAPGIYIYEAADNTIGGTAAGAGNVITANLYGLVSQMPTSTGNSILGNAIYANTFLGIDVNWDDITPNDPGDADAGSNDFQNFPVITSATTNASNSVRLVGSLNSNASVTYRIEFFATPTGDGGGHGEGQTYLGSVNVTTNGSGNASFDTLLASSVPVGTQITATATVDEGGSNYGSTSEFALNATAANTAPVITSNGGGATATGNVAENTTAVTTVAATDADTWDTITYTITGGADAARFTIDATTGVLGFLAAPDFESPTDAGADNVYDLVVTATDGLGATDSQAIAVTVTDVSSALVVTTTADTNDTGLGAAFNAEQLNASRGTDGAISLREALIAANNTAGTDTIGFNIAGAGVHTINVAAALPQITGTVVIDGYTQAGSSANTLAVGSDAVLNIRLRGPGLGGAAFDGLRFEVGSAGSTVRGLQIAEFASAGIMLVSTGNTVSGNWIGLDTNGDDALGNRWGVRTSGGSNTIGGDTPALRNVISGNSDSGVYLQTGSGNVVRGNYLGTNAAGTAAVGNLRGVYLHTSGSNTIGGAAAGQGNLISGNADDGIRIRGSSGNVIQGNAIGLNAGGTGSLGNLYGIWLDTNATNNLIGGTTGGTGNTLTGNAFQGILAFASSGGALDGNRFLGNSLYGNGSLGIDLQGSSGVTPNDGALTAGQPNQLMDSPVIGTANLNGSSLNLSGHVGSAAGQALFAGSRVEFFLSDGDASGFGEGRTYLGFLTADANGNFSGTLTGVSLASGDRITATATNTGNNTSEFGANATVNLVPVITPTATPLSYTENDAPTPVDAAVTLVDADGSLQGATVRITGNYAASQDVLAFADQSGITGSWDALTGTLTLTGTASVADYQAALRSVTYFNTSESPSTAVRTLSFSVDDGTVASATATRQINVTAANDAPVLTSNGGGAAAAVSVAENGTAVTTATAADVDLPAQTLTYSIAGGADATRFTIDAATGLLSFIAAPDFEAPSDAGADNVYDVTVQVSDGSASDTQAIVVTVIGVDDNGPVITSNGGGTAAVVSVAENGTAVTTVTAADADLPAQTLIYSIVGGADAARFAIDPATGALRFIAAPDFEAALDADGDNVYNVVVQVSDGSFTDTQAVGVQVVNVNEAPSMLGTGTVTIPRGAGPGTVVLTVTVSDPDVGDAFTFALVDDAGGRFAIDPSNGRIVIAAGALPPADGASSFDLRVRVTDAGGLSFEQPLRVDLRDVQAEPLPAPEPLPLPGGGSAPPPMEPGPAAPAPEAPREPLTPAPDARGPGNPAPGAGGQGQTNAPGPDSLAPAEGAASQGGMLRWRSLGERDDIDALIASVSFDAPLPGDGAAVTFTADPATSRGAGLALRGARSAALDSLTADTSEGSHDADRPLALAEAASDPVRVASVTFTAGFIWWLTRSGGLITTMLMGVPAWRHVDLLPVLARPVEDDEDEDAPGPPKQTDDKHVARLFDTRLTDKTRTLP